MRVRDRHAPRQRTSNRRVPSRGGWWSDQVFVEAEGESRTQNGLDYNNRYGIVLRLKDGKIAEIREYMDTELVKRIFG